MASFKWRERLSAASIHLAISASIAALAALLVFAVWYPYPYREVSGGRELFILVVTVDVLLGPLITFSIFDRRKAWPVMRRDLTVVGVIQLAALLYGLWTVFVARPVHLVYEIDRFRVVHAIDVPADMLSKTPASIEALPLTGPTLISVRDFKNSGEKVDAVFAALGGLQMAERPDFWQPYDAGREMLLKTALPMDKLLKRFPNQQDLILQCLRELNREPQNVLYLPMAARKSFWTVLVDAKNGDVLGFLPLDSF